MKKPLTSLLIITLILGIFWVGRDPVMRYFFPCESFGCLGSGILYLFTYTVTAIVGYIILLVWLYKSSGNFTKSFSYVLLSLLVLFGIVASDGFMGKIAERNAMKDAYTDCINTFSGKVRDLSYCDTYKTHLGN